jgi:hypothetical protein
MITVNFFYGAVTSEPSFMVTMYYIFGSIALMATLLDLNMIIRGGAHRIARHLWRMCYAMLGAVLSFVANTSDRWSDYLDENLPIYLLIVIMFYWLIRVLFTKWFDKTQSTSG